MKILYIALEEAPRIVYLRSVSTSTQALGDYLSTPTISNTSNEYQIIMFWPTIPIILTIRVQVVTQPLSLSTWKLPFHAIKLMKLVLLAICSPLKRKASNLERHSSKRLTLVVTLKSSPDFRRTQQHMDLEFQDVAHLTMSVFRIFKFFWCVCYLLLLTNVASEERHKSRDKRDCASAITVAIQCCM